MRTKELMLYGDMEDGQILSGMTRLINEADGQEEIPEDKREEMRESLTKITSQLVELAVSHGFTGNLWQAYLTWLLVNDENAYSKECEVVGEIRAVSTRSHSMILRFSKRHLIMILSRFSLLWRKIRFPFFLILKEAQITEKS